MKLNCCLIGKGNVGTCLLELIEEKKPTLKNMGIDLVVIAIFEFDGALINHNGLNISKIIEIGDNFRNLEEWNENLSALDSIPNLNLDICIETTPTNPKTGEPAISHILKAIENHIDVVASNKGPFYLHYRKIDNLARQNNCFVKYEATVASCVPAISIKESLLANEIISIKAILNGTSNYILSRMSSEGVDFSLALKEAQELGYAESDPSLDIEGYDAAGKIVILSNALLDWNMNINDVEINGISKITPQAIELAKSDGFVIKHLAIAKNNKLIVKPRMIDKDSPLNIGGTLNVIEFKTKHAGPIILMGRGAGGYEAASAILNDIISIHKIRSRR